MTDSAESAPAGAVGHYGQVRAPGPADYALLVGLGAIWGSAFLAIKVAVADVPPLTLAAVRLAIGGGVLLVYISLIGAAWPRGRRTWSQLAAIAVVSTICPFFLISWAEQWLNSGLAAILMATGPFVAIGLSHFTTDDDRITRWKLVGCALGFAGVVLAIGMTAVRTGSEVGLLPLLAPVVAAACYSVGGALTRRVRGIPPETMSACVLATGAALAVPLALVLDRPWTVPMPSVEALAALLYLALVPTAIAYMIRFRLIVSVGYTFLSFAGYLIPVFGVLWGAAFLAEPVGATTVAALALILTGTWLSRQ